MELLSSFVILYHPKVHGILSSELATLIEENLEKLLVIDSRSFLEYNDSHVQGSINIQSSKLIRKRLEQNKLNIIDLLKDANHDEVDKVVIYDQSTSDISLIPREHFMYLIATKLHEQFNFICYLQGKLCQLLFTFFQYFSNTFFILIPNFSLRLNVLTYIFILILRIFLFSF